MKILATILMALALSLVALAQSQDQSTTQPSQNSQGQTNTATGTAGGQNMSGTVSHNGKNFTNDKDSKSYKIDNPDALAGKQDQHVALVVHVDPDNNVIHILQVEPPQ